MSWFEELVGFAESTSAVREYLSIDGETMTSRMNGRVMQAGSLTTPTLAELREAAAAASEHVPMSPSRPTVREVVANVAELHRDPANAGALFQVASQFNLLEMPSPEVTPEAGVSSYEHDHTQGPACAVACGAGTIFRNWFVDVNGQIGQTTDRQIDCLADVGAELGNERSALWKMINGYALLTGRVPADVPTTHPLLRVGVHANTEVTLGDAGHMVTQVYCSALPVTYSAVSAAAAEPLARMVLNSAYEATLCAAVASAAANGERRVYLTLLGGGVFGNPVEWIVDAITHALDAAPHVGLDIAIVSHRSANPALQPLLDRYRQ